MARQTDIRLRRSAVSGNIPTTAQLNLGELALNTADGKAYMKKSIGGVETVIEIGGGVGISQDAVWKEYNYTATEGQTIFTGADNNSNTLSYLVGYIHVFYNGVLLAPTDYTATNGTSVVLTDPLTAGDLIQIESFIKL